VSIQHLVSIF